MVYQNESASWSREGNLTSDLYQRFCGQENANLPDKLTSQTEKYRTWWAAVCWKSNANFLEEFDDSKIRCAIFLPLALQSRLNSTILRIRDAFLLFPILKYCILIGCSLPPESDIMQDDVNCPISLSWKRWWHNLTNNTLLRGRGCFENNLSSQN